jgi:aldehyde dehydrogenase (NAD+)
MNMIEVLASLDIQAVNSGLSTGHEWTKETHRSPIEILSPINGRPIAAVTPASEADYEAMMVNAQRAFEAWCRVPAPKRGEVVRAIGDELRRNKDALGRLVTLEMGKSLQEGWGEVQEMIDIADFAVGLSRQLYGLSMHSERTQHRMYEQYHPLGPVGVITAFNFPVAVWAWNALIAAVCGDVTIWKPASKVPLCAVAVQKLVARAVKPFNIPEGVFNLIIGGGRLIGEKMITDHRIPLISLTGSTPVGKKAAASIAGRLGRYIMELGGNNAIILTENADLALAIPAVVFGAIGTAGQRCTTTRRLIVHESIYERVKNALIGAFGTLRIGNPMDPSNHVGPLIDRAAVEQFAAALKKVQQEGGRLLFGGDILHGADYESGCYVRPALVEAQNHYPTVQEETFAPILYLIPYRGTVEEAVALQNAVPQGLSSSIFTKSILESEVFLSAWGSDCGIANVNIGTSGAEIGGAFGGEKDTGGGREAGSDVWKSYMRRQTNTINFGRTLPLAQGIKFDI